MIITRKYALELIRKGKAKRINIIRENNRLFIALNRFDLQRVDHYITRPADYRTKVIFWNGEYTDTGINF